MNIYIYIYLCFSYKIMPMTYFPNLIQWSSIKTTLFHFIDILILKEAGYTICSIIQKMMSYVHWLKIVCQDWLLCKQPQKTKERRMIYEADIMQQVKCMSSSAKQIKLYNFIVILTMSSQHHFSQSHYVQRVFLNRRRKQPGKALLKNSLCLYPLIGCFRVELTSLLSDN